MGRNLVKLKKLKTSSLIPKYDVIIVILMCNNWGSRKSSLFLCFWMGQLKFGVRGNFRLLISSLNSKTEYLFAILWKCHFSSLKSWFLAQHSFMNWLPWQQWMVYLPSFNFKNFYIYLHKSNISLVKISWTVFEIFSQNAQRSAIFQLSHFDDVIKSTRRWRHQNFLSICKDLYP